MGSSRKRDFLPGHGPYAPLADASRVRVRNQGSSRTCNEADKLLLLKKSKFGEWARRCHDFTTTPPTSRKDMRWTCASRDGRQDHLRQDPAMPHCCMVSGGAEPTMVKTTTTMSPDVRCSAMSAMFDVPGRQWMVPDEPTAVTAMKWSMDNVVQ